MIVAIENNILLVYTNKLISESCPIKQNFDCNYTFPIELAAQGNPPGAKWVRKVNLQLKFGLI